uniref:Galectin n=1 Tax=Meloidogyne javanica TaxID=6303 RepID=A0A915N8K5_MELJA
MELPATINLSQLSFGRGFLPDKSIEINITVLANPDQFVVNLFEDGIMQETADIPFHFKPLFSHSLLYPSYVYRNNWIKNKGWGEGDGGFDRVGFRFRAGRTFILEFVAAPKNTIIVNVNNKSFLTFRRVDLSQISQLYIDGRGTIRVNSLTLCPQIYLNNQHVGSFSRVDLSEISQLYIEGGNTIQLNSMTLCTKIPSPPTPPFCDIRQIELNNLKIPSIIDLEEIGFRRGFTYAKIIRILGTATAPTNFDISLVEDGIPEETADIPFHFSADFAQNEVSE